MTSLFEVDEKQRAGRPGTGNRHASDSVYGHQLGLQLAGAYVPERSEPLRNGDQVTYRQLRLRMVRDDEPEEPASLRLPVVPADMTAYAFLEGQLWYEGEPVIIPGVTISEVPVPPTESLWHMKGYTFPYRGGPRPYHELRLSPRITGYCPGRCQFCHRAFSHRNKPDDRHVAPLAELVDRVCAAEGDAVLGQVGRVMLISELYGREDRFLDAVEEAREVLLARGYPPDREFNCCANEARSAEGLIRLRSLVQPSRYSYTLECFDRREEIMGWYKGIPMPDVIEVLTRAREAGFEEIQINYMAGLDSPQDCIRGFTELRSLDLVDSVGISTFTAFSPQQAALRHPAARGVVYYDTVANTLAELGILVYRPESYDMRLPCSLSMERTLL